MRFSFYKLGELKIVEADNGALWWEAHGGLGDLKRGKCFIRGDMLFIGPSKNEEAGFLKREFVDRLQGYPHWEKTKYFCSSYSIHECQFGRKLTEKEISERAGNSPHSLPYTEFSQWLPGEETSTEGSDLAKDVSYKLGQYEISKKTDGQVRWKTFLGYCSLKEGRCFIAGDILFLGAAESDEQGNMKQAFLKRLDQLPEWRITRFYCPYCVIYDCRTGENVAGKEGDELPSEAPPPSTKGSIVPRVRTIPSHPPLPKPWRSRLYHSSISFQKRIVGKTDSGVEWKPYEACLKVKRSLKSKIIQRGVTALKSSIRKCPIERWIANIGALKLMIGDLVLALFPGNNKNRDGHHNHGEQSSNRDRGD